MVKFGYTGLKLWFPRKLANVLNVSNVRILVHSTMIQ